MRRSLRALLVASLLAACSSTTNGTDGADAALDAVAADGTSADGSAAADAPSSSDAPAASDTPSSPSDAGTFACGTLRCDTATQYCQVLTSGTLPDGGTAADYRCDPFDFVCMTDHTCACLQRNLKCSTMCTEPTGHVTTFCGF